MSILFSSKLSAPFDPPEKLRGFVNNIEIRFNPDFDISYELNNNSVLTLTEVQRVDGEPIFFERLSSIKLLIKDKIVFKGLTEDSQRGHFDVHRRKVIDSLKCLDWRKMLDYIRVSLSVVDNTPLQSIKKVESDLESNGFELGELNFTLPNVRLKGYSIEDAPISELLTFICDTSNSFWSVKYDYMKDKHIITTHSKNKTAIQLKQEDLESPTHEIEESVCNSENLEYANTLKIEVDDYDVGSRNEETIIYIGESEFTLQFGVGEVISIQQILNIQDKYSIRLNNKYAANNLEKDQGVIADFYYTIGDNRLELNEDKFNLTDLNGATFKIVYRTRSNLVRYFYNNKEVRKLQNRFKTTGEVSLDKSVKYINGEEELNRYKDNFFDTYSKPQVSLNVRTKKRIYEMGDIVEFESKDPFFSVQNRTSRFVVKEVNEDWMTASVRGKDDSYIVTYTYELNNVMNGLDYINYFDDRNIDKYINLRDNGKITKTVRVIDNYNLIFEVCEVENVINQ